MTSSTPSRLIAIAFECDIEILTEGFPGREWIFEEIYLWFQQDNERLFILTGERGIGKSAIAAHLTQTRNDIVAYHLSQATDFAIAFKT
jgi:hypothetical protein